MSEDFVSLSILKHETLQRWLEAKGTHHCGMIGLSVNFSVSWAACISTHDFLSICVCLVCFSTEGFSCWLPCLGSGAISFFHLQASTQTPFLSLLYHLWLLFWLLPGLAIMYLRGSLVHFLQRMNSLSLGWEGKSLCCAQWAWVFTPNT